MNNNNPAIAIEFFGDIDMDDNIHYGTILYKSDFKNGIAQTQKPILYSADMANRKRIALKNIDINPVDENLADNEIKQIKKFIRDNLLLTYYIY